MTPHEQQWLDDLLQRLSSVQGAPQDPQAMSMIRERLVDRPDAVYLLVQRLLLLEQALQDAQRQIAQLSQPSSPAGGSLLRGAPGVDWGRSPGAPAIAAAMPEAPDRYAPGAPPRSAEPGWRERLSGGAPAAGATRLVPASGPGLLGTAASAAAGVAGGMFLFNGIEHLLGQRGQATGNAASADSPAQRLHEDAGSAGTNGGGAHADNDALARDAGADWIGNDDAGSGSGIDYADGSGFDAGGFDDDSLV